MRTRKSMYTSKGNGMNFFQAARLILALLPVLIDAIKAAEEALPGKGKGEVKLAMVRAALEAAYSISNDTVVRFEQVWPALQSVITSIVTTFNTFKIFAKDA